MNTNQSPQTLPYNTVTIEAASGLMYVTICKGDCKHHVAVLFPREARELIQQLEKAIVASES